MAPHKKPANEEKHRLEEDRAGGQPWRRWGPYLSERQWGTVREDYSRQGTAWDYFPHDHARSRAYRWGEDGLAGISDDEQRLCLALALAAPASSLAGEKALPETTFAYLKIENAAKLRQSFKASQLGQLLADPALQPLKESQLAALLLLGNAITDH